MRRILQIFLCLLSVQVMAQSDTTRERIINFHSDIHIDTTGLVTVAEHIRVHANGNAIKHGIVRFIPLYRKDVLGNQKKVDFKIVSVKQDDKTVDYKAEEEDNNRKIYVGDPFNELTPGDYDYTIVYESHGHVGFFDNYDELYWNVTGNKWDFEIEKASATIWPPGSSVSGNTSCYTGMEGSKAQDCQNSVNADHSVTFTTNHSLAPGEGFTIAVAFTSGIIKRPGKLQQLYNDYLGIIAGVLLVIIAAVVYYTLWSKYGRDVQKPTVIPSFRVPYDWSPAVLRYVYKKSADNKATAAAMINMAIKKTIKIDGDEKKQGVYTFNKLTNDRSKLADEEQTLFNGLFEDGDSISTAKSNATTFFNARKLFTKSIEAQLKLSDYYVSNLKQAILSGVGSVIALIIYFIAAGYTSALMMLFFLPFICFGSLALVYGLRNVKGGNKSGLILMIFGALFGGIPLFSMINISIALPPIPVIVAFSILALYLLYIFNIGRYTALGAQAQSMIEGFKMYLKTAEENRLNILNAPERTPEVFERFLPYAVALDVENDWAAKFESILSAANYDPDWYNDQRGYHVFVNHIPTTFYNAVNILPVSESGSSSGSSGSSSWSSGSDGGGSSGGGGGGGGGGGW
ncbi:DUF2207 domain-containing protein [Mucilaginibacter sp. KACC 22063]|uniref:DUF2207 domain-containing protein n=1 Tax=Mucilaginibacter sp. KACC 22063 TaxID=3025666 RepID=UPI0023665387|nr:DUF2207 domain-containing protein [Mucilaginibacter sp. KACC 22063]WDF54407.1 DUF2207 domain-containing protein [Mucilaginibacter sp. KACC 22063]